jgi:PD-(D/E)XK nuclease superfamily
MSTLIRASSLPQLFDCPARWAAIHLDGKKMPSNSKAMLGKAVHASTAVYDQSVIDGSGITISEAAGVAVDTIRKPDEEVDWEDEDPDDAARIAISLHAKYCTVIAPRHTYSAVEVKCDALKITDIGITLTGTTDRVYKTEDGFGIADVKTGKQAVGSDGHVNTKGHAYQMGVYELLAEKGSGIPITEPARIFGMNTAKTPASQRVAIGEISGARDILLGDEESPGILQMGAKLIHGGDFWGNPKSMLCHKRYCPVYEKCKFRK